MRLVRQIFNLMSDGIDLELSDYDLAPSQSLTLSAIASGQIRCMTDVNRVVGLVSGAATRHIDQLEKRGLVTRARSAGDRRVVHVALTSAGEAVVAAAQPRLEGFWEEAVAAFAPIERERLFALLSRLRDGLAARIA